MPTKPKRTEPIRGQAPKARFIENPGMGYGRAWQKLRMFVLRREPMCRSCGAAANEVDHIRPRSMGGTDDLDNLQPLCKPCHSRKTLKESVNTNR